MRTKFNIDLYKEFFKDKICLESFENYLRTKYPFQFFIEINEKNIKREVKDYIRFIKQQYKRIMKYANKI